MRVHFFFFRKPGRFLDDQNNDNKWESNRNVIPTTSEKNQLRLFFIRILRFGSKGKHPINEFETGTSTDRSSSTPSQTTPISFIDMTTNKNQMNRMELSFNNKRSISQNLIERHGLDRNDSIISYIREVDGAFQEIAFTVPNNYNDTIPIDNRNDDDDDIDTYANYETSRHYTLEEMNQGISVLTMDPALLYSHSIVIDEYDWKSFISIDEKDEYTDDAAEEERTAKIRYFDI